MRPCTTSYLGFELVHASVLLLLLQLERVQALQLLWCRLLQGGQLLDEAGKRRLEAIGVDCFDD